MVWVQVPGAALHQKKEDQTESSEPTLRPVELECDMSSTAANRKPAQATVCSTEQERWPEPEQYRLIPQAYRSNDWSQCLRSKSMFSNAFASSESAASPTSWRTRECGKQVRMKRMVDKDRGVYGENKDDGGGG
jgi:hypothetical protein